MADIFDVAVIGAGAAGMMGAIWAAKEGARVLLLDQNTRPGNKLLLTGNGRCNLTHLDDKIDTAYHSDSKDSLSCMMPQAFSLFGVEDTIDFFEEMGLCCHDRDGYVYPRSDQSASVLTVLTDQLRRSGVKQKYHTKVTALEKTSMEGLAVWKVQVPGWEYYAKCVILSAGSKAFPDTGSDGSGYKIAAPHTIVTPVSALSGMISSDPYVSIAAGSRTQAHIVLSIQSGKEAAAYEDEGQVQWNKDGVSGICVMQLSRHVSRILQRDAKARCLLKVDLVPDMEQSALYTKLQYISALQHISAEPNRWKKEEMMHLLIGFLPDKIIQMIYAFWEDFAEDASHLSSFAAMLKAFPIHICSTRGFDQSQVCAGGVSLDEIDPRSMESRLCPGLYFAGEILDVDGPCGGYNLQWAWTSGKIAGCAAASAALNCH